MGKPLSSSASLSRRRPGDDGGLPFGRLPGDYTVRRGAFTFYFPLASSILVSVVLTVVLYLLRR